MSAAQSATNFPSFRKSAAPAFQEAIARDARAATEVFTEVAPSDVSTAAVSRSEYTSKDFAETERSRMWSRVWQVACRVEQIPEPGDCHVYEGPYASMLIVHGDDGNIRAFENSCRHRGMRLCAGDASLKRITCPFHSFSWHLDGSLAHIPSRWDFPDVEGRNLSLIEAQVSVWGGFVFINHDPDCKPLSTYLGHLIPHFEAWPRDRVYAATIIRKTINANWKACIEAFQEAYHLSGIHAQALPFGGDSSTQYDVWPDDPHVSRFMQPLGFQSDHYARRISEQDVLASAIATVMGRDAPVPELPDGKTARSMLLDMMRASLGDDPAAAAMCDVEVLDAIQYSLFPNIVLFRSMLYPYAYRFLPVRGEPGKTVFDFFVFKPLPDSGAPPETVYCHLSEDQSYADSGALPPWLGQIYDQDSYGLAECQTGMETGGNQDIFYASYQEVRLRHLHQTLHRYLSGAL